MMQKILNLLLDEFLEKLTKSEESTPRAFHFSTIKNKVKVAIGVRRAGKTYFLLQKIRELRKQNISLSRVFYLNFEDDRLLPADKEKLAGLVDAFYQAQPENHYLTCYLFFDEIQNVEDWPVVIRRLLDTK